MNKFAGLAVITKLEFHRDSWIAVKCDKNCHDTLLAVVVRYDKRK